MPFALVQQRLEFPDVAAVARALEGAGEWHPVDAAHLVADAFGILLRNLEEIPGRDLELALRREGVGVDLVDERDLPVPPISKKLRRAEVRPEAFVAVDPYDREILVPWDRIEMICAGAVRMTRFRPVTWNRDRDPSSWGEESRSPLDASITLRQEKREWCWMADLLMAGRTLRFSFASGEFVPTEPEETGNRDPEERFRRFLRGLLAHVPQAILNRGAFAVREDDPDAAPRYPTRNAYQEEMIWLMRRMQGRGA
ncbi:MAG: hypothetical protein JNL10_13545 [Verrucomicrobiales bacterium]|nr:hypothetical protein [Verrucomicrobiales bacterium]